MKFKLLFSIVLLLSFQNFGLAHEMSDMGDMHMPAEDNSTDNDPSKLSKVPDILAFLGTLGVTAAIAIPCAIFVSRCQRMASVVNGPEYHRLKQSSTK